MRAEGPSIEKKAMPRIQLALIMKMLLFFGFFASINAKIGFIPTVLVKARTHDSITIEWSRDEDRVYKYKIRKRLLPERNGTVIPFADVEWPNTKSTHVFELLPSYTDVLIGVAACNEEATECGDYDYIRTHTMMPDPAFTPTVSILATTSNSIGIGWSTPSPELQDRVYQYGLRVLRLQDNREYRETSYFPNTTNNETIGELEAGASFKIAVAACTKNETQCGSWSNVVEAQAIDRDPKFIPNLFVLATTDYSITIGWSTPPPELQGRVHQYKMTAVSSIHTSGPDYVPKTVNSHVFRNLSPGREYSLKIAACGEYIGQCGNWSSENAEWTFNPDPKFIPNVTVEATTRDSITIGWSTLPPELKNDSLQYGVMAVSQDKILGPVYLSKSEKMHVFENLRNETYYQLRVAACRTTMTVCSGDWSAAQEGLTIDRDPKFIPQIWVKATTLDSITIGWSMPPPKLQGRVHRYKVMANRKNKTSAEPVYLAKSSNSYVFKNLLSQTSYRLKVAACSDYITQCGDWSSEQEGQTIDRDPKFVPTLRVKETTHNSVTFEWTEPSDKLRDRVHKYKVIAIHQQDMRGPIYLNKTEHSYAFENLTSQTSYRLKVAACSDYITQCGNWSSEEEVFTIDKDEKAQDYVIQSGLSVGLVLLAIAVVWMIIRKRREQAARKKFMEETLKRLDLETGDCLNPELNVGDRADVLPYNNKWEYPRELLKLDKVLGSGAFGIVRKAQAKSICRPESVTTVAVKMVLATARLNYMTALSRELRILCYLGQHLNVVNLLGACTRNISYGELFVIVEFCRYGNLRDYLFRHRLDFETENITTSSMNTVPANANDSGATTSVSDGDVATEVSFRSTDSKDLSVAVEDCAPSTDSVDLGLRSKYEGDYADADSKPISTRDLICWAWQVSRGMKFLGYRRILHGDLAARNILLADRNVVKICDFGLSKALYTDENYKKTDHDPLPVKWMAIESLKDRIFSAKSDVWSFGVVLWEFFSLGETPYPGIGAREVKGKLDEGYRMERPKYASRYMYNMMLECWDANPSKRPTFAKLVNDLSDLLDDNVRTEYMDLDAPYIQMNERDYLIMSPPEETSDEVEPTPE